MEANVIKCPNCGASSSNHTNCEYCGSLLVRFADKGIDLANTLYTNKTEVFPGLIDELKKNLNLQKENLDNEEPVETLIYWIDKDGSSNHQLYISPVQEEEARPNTYNSLTFYLDFTQDNDFDHSETDEQYSKFTRLDSFSLFKSEYEKFDWGYSRLFDINFGQDAEGAARIITEILIKVYGLSINDTLRIFTGIGDEVANKIGEWDKSFGIKYDIDENDDNINNENSNEKYVENPDGEQELSEGSEDNLDRLGFKWYEQIIFWPWSILISLLLFFFILDVVWLPLIICALSAIAAVALYYGYLNKKYLWPVVLVSTLLLVAIGYGPKLFNSNIVEQEAEIEESPQTEKVQEKKSRKDEIRELGYNDGVKFGYSDGGDALREYVQMGTTLENGLNHIQNVIAKVAYKEDYGNDISDELLDEYCKQFIEGYKSVVLKK